MRAASGARTGDVPVTLQRMSRTGGGRRISVVGYATHAMTSRLHGELLRRGHDVEVLHPDRLVTEVHRGRISVHPFDGIPLPDALVLTASSDHVAAVHSAAQLERAGVPVANRPSAVLTASDKAQTAVILAAAGVPVPRAVSVASIDAAMTHAARLGYPLVLKAADGAEGNQVRYVVDAAHLPAAFEALRNSMRQELSDRTPLVVQQAVRRSLGRDRRAFVVAGVVQAVMDRVARVGEWRSNLSQGASPVPAVATDQEADIAVRSALALGLEFTTIDMMSSDDGPVVIEANPYGDVLDVGMTSGMDLIGSLADLAEMAAGARSRGPVRPEPLTASAHHDLTAFCVARLRDKSRELGLPDPVARAVATPPW